MATNPEDWPEIFFFAPHGYQPTADDHRYMRGELLLFDEPCSGEGCTRQKGHPGAHGTITALIEGKTDRLAANEEG